MAEVLTSEWLGLNKHLIAQFFEVDSNGNRLDQNITVEAPLTDGNFEATFNWQSAFENSGAETKAPTLSAMFQSGEMTEIGSTIGGGIDGISKFATGSGLGAKDSLSGKLKQYEGKTGITKLNSIQVFTGMPPIKIPITILFRAWRNAKDEVESPFDQMMKWALPVQLADRGMLARMAKKRKPGESLIYPSTVPALIGMKYKNRLYSPMVIESIGYPMTSPIEQEGNFVELSVQITLATLAAYDRRDWDKVNRG